MEQDNINSSTPIDTTAYWRHLWLTVISIRFHWLFLQARAKTNFLSGSITRRLAAIVFVIVLATWTILNHALPAFVVAVVFPLSLLYHVASLLQFLSEHLWGSSQNDSASKSHGRFCGEAPPRDSSFFAWCYWSARMAGHFLVRVAILPGEMPEHDWHHKSPKRQKEWANGTYVRQREVEAGGEYIDLWGLRQAIDRVFQGLAKASDTSER